MLKKLEALQKFLQSLNSLRQQGLIKTVDQAVAFAKQEFGEVNDLFRRQIEQIFKGPAKKAPPPGGGGITSIKNAPKKETPDQESGISFSIPERGIIRQKASIEEITDMIKNNPYRPKKGLDPVEGMTRTAARVVLDRYGIKVPERVDPIEAFEENFGGDALMDLKNVGEELLEKEVRGKITESMGEFLESRGMFDLKVDKTARKGMTDDELIKKLTEDVDEAYGVDDAMKRKLDQEDIDKAIEQEDMLFDFDPKGRKPNALGGFNRVGYAEGPENPKKKTGIMKVIKKVPKLGKLVGGLETIMNKFGTDAIGTLEDFYQKGKLKLNPEAKKFQEDRKAVFDFQKRQLDKTEADANKEMDDIIQDQIQGGFIRDMKKSMQKDMQRESKKAGKGRFTKAEVLEQIIKNTIKNLGDDPEVGEYIKEVYPGFLKEIKANPELANNENVFRNLTTQFIDNPNQRLVVYDDDTVDFFTKGTKYRQAGEQSPMARSQALADELGISFEEAVKIGQMEPADQILEIERRRRLKNRKLNSEGGLQYLMGM